MSFAQNSVDSCVHLGDRYRMIDSVKISNFRCFRELTLEKCSPINVIVGDNGCGKTTVLEAIFLALCANPQKALMLRQYRGMDGSFSGDANSIVEIFYSDLVPDKSVTEIILSGSGPEVRTLRIVQGRRDLIIPKDARAASDAQMLSPYIFEWVDAEGIAHPTRTKITNQGLEFEGTGEDNLPTWFFFPSQAPTPSAETAERFSELRRQRRSLKFIQTFTETFDWIEDISVESVGGTPMLHAAVRGAQRLLPLPAVSGAINRFAAILLGIAYRPKGIVLVDEIENGIFHTRYPTLMKALLNFAREYETQLFVSTHSKEMLDGFIAATEDKVSDIALWRLERSEDSEIQVLRFDGKAFKAGVQYGTEVRG